MKILIYSNSSFGGIYEYALQIGKAFNEHSKIEWCKLVFPKNIEIKSDNYKNILLKDASSSNYRILQKIYFLYRSVVNPFIFRKYIKKAKPDIILFNDFDQISWFIWVPFFRFFKVTKGIYLHDPDRDCFFPLKIISRYSMKQIMKLMDFALYHEKLPKKSYYLNLKKCRFINIPHGIYPLGEPDSVFEQYIVSLQQANCFFACIPGNIRSEKNYHHAIGALAEIKNMILIIAGKKANSNIDIEKYKKQALELGVEKRLIIIEKYLSNHELAALFKYSKIILLYYSASFQSQSGILNLLSETKNKIIVSDTNSGLSNVVNKYKLGLAIKPDDSEELIQGIKQMLNDKISFYGSWKKYIQYASWKNNINISMDAFLKK